MIKYLQHTQIDKALWDSCISNSVNRKVYAYAWYLDHVCPGWDALVEDDYAAVFPLTHRRKWGIAYLYQPFFVQQLGVFSPAELNEEQVRDFIHAIPGQFQWIDIHLNDMNRCHGTPGEVTLRSNYELSLSSAYNTLTASYAQNTRRNLKKSAEHAITIRNIDDAGELITLFRENYGKKEGKLQEENYQVLQHFIVDCLEKGRGYISGAFNRNDQLSAAAFFLLDRDRYYFLFAASGTAARENGAMFCLIDRFISDHAGKNLMLDFEGGNDPNLGRFYQSFGAHEVPYPALRISRLPKLAEKGLYFIRKFSK